MGGRNSRPSPPPPPRTIWLPAPPPEIIYNYVDYRNEINNLQNNINQLNQNIADLTSYISEAKTKNSNIEKQNSEYINDIYNKENEIITLTYERDQLINNLNIAKQQYDNLQNSISLADDQLNVVKSQATSLSSNYLKTTLDTINSQNRIYQSIKSQNDTLLKNKKLKELNKEYRTNDQKSFYQFKNNDFLNFLNIILFLLYFVLVAILTYILYRNNMNFLIILISVLFFISYPFFIGYIESVIYYIIKNAYNNFKYQTN
jgi:DNA repair exonuclease SbcCD ATPase subunit